MSVIRSTEFDLPELPAPYFLQVYAHSPPGTPAQTFRYQPRLVDGRAVAVEGVRNTFHYRIE